MGRDLQWWHWPCSAHLSPSPWCPLCHAWFCPGGPCSCPDWTGMDSCLDCRLLMRDNMSKCPAEYCSMTSITSYGRRLSLNLRLDTKNRITLQRWIHHEFQIEAILPGASSHIHLSVANSSNTTIPGLPTHPSPPWATQCSASLEPLVCGSCWFSEKPSCPWPPFH